MKKTLLTLSLMFLLATPSWASHQTTKVCYVAPGYKQCHYSYSHQSPQKYCHKEKFYRGHPKFCRGQHRSWREDKGRRCDKGGDHSRHGHDDYDFYAQLGHDFGDGYIKIGVKK